jgi:hypothetical protein
MSTSPSIADPSAYALIGRFVPKTDVDFRSSSASNFASVARVLTLQERVSRPPHQGVLNINFASAFARIE